MAQTIKLRRSNSAGAVPTTGQMETGELAMNTADGKLFLRDNTLVRPIVTVDNQVTGSINLIGGITASSYISSSGLRVPDLGSGEGPSLWSANRLSLSGSSIYLDTALNDIQIYDLPVDTTSQTTHIIGISSGGKLYRTASAVGGTSLTGQDTAILFFDGNDNPSTSHAFTYDVSEERFQVGGGFPSFSTNTVNPWNIPGYEATGSTVASETTAFITNVDYTIRRFNVIGLAEHGLGPSGVIGAALPANALPTAYTAPVPGILPAPLDLDDNRMGINGQLRLGNLWAWVYSNGKTDLVTYGSFVSVPGSPGLTMGDGGLRLFTSESMKFDLSGSLLTPKESASVEFSLANDAVDPALAVKLRDGTSLNTILYISQSGRIPRVGIGTTDPKSALDVKDIRDDGTGTEFVLKTTRSTQGAQVGDKAGTLSFTVDSGSFNDYRTSGSVAAIESEITSVDETGVTGDLILRSSNATKSAPAEVLRINQTESSFSSSIKTHGALTIGPNSIYITNEEDTSISTESETIDLWVTASYNGAIYDYTLVKAGTGGRVGQFMVMALDGEITYTDTSAPSIGGITKYPEITATLSGDDVSIVLISGSGYNFKSLRKLI